MSTHPAGWAQGKLSKTENDRHEQHGYSVFGKAPSSHRRRTRHTNLAARFADAVNQRDADAFRQLWADGAAWEIGPPFAMKATGVDAIARMLEDLFRPKTLFFQLTHSGVVTFTGEDTATARFAERERGKGEKDFYENLAVYHDEYVRGPDGWLFRSRYYEYRFLDTSAFSGDVFPPTMHR